MLYLSVKTLHMLAAALTISGFMLRGFWMLTESPMLQKRWVRIAPHVVDALFLATGISLIWILSLPVMSQPWLVAKLIAIVIYIVLGAIALRRGRTKQVRVIAFVLALATFAYIVGVALSKSMGSWFVLAIR
jgi:uncharacterized membrane protein SirB2